MRNKLIYYRGLYKKKKIKMTFPLNMKNQSYSIFDTMNFIDYSVPEIKHNLKT